MKFRNITKENIKRTKQNKQMNKRNEMIKVGRNENKKEKGKGRTSKGGWLDAERKLKMEGNCFAIIMSERE